jgi:hypothetical protein
MKMAKQELYSIQDKVAKIYNRPMPIVNFGKAMQVFSQMVNDEQDSDIKKWPEQFNLVKLGTYDEETGKIDSFDTPEIIANGLDVLEEKNKTFTLEQLAELINQHNEKNVIKMPEAK